ncbi:MAG: hypothetical protein HY852_24860 [Bradyrhizobium sp.]|uniref:hypothetical protein n=1 Tax=Bradyrhizobium sp. TaxID=376 RepID=UPI0025BBAC9D|nr:hypothetical protein [Bradyrhizobium sp.]MBI5265038.1 hypothetical protein [Bradyrhizobium sp.]
MDAIYGHEHHASEKSNHGTYLAAALAGAILFVVGAFSLLVVLEWFGRLPPPPIANNICIDEKLSFMRDRSFGSPNVLIAGSSVAWRSIDGEAMVSAAKHLQPLNGGFCGLQVNQAAFVGDWLVDRFASIRTVVFVVSPFDFEGCSTSPMAAFDLAAADEYVFGRASKWSFYMRNFDPGSMVRNVLRVGSMRKPGHFYSLVFTKFGDGPVDALSSERTLMYGPLRRLDGTCFSALASMADRLASESKAIMVVGVPLHPKWKELYDHDGTIRARLREGIVKAIEPSGGKYWDGDAESSTSSEEFLDAIHLRWPATKTLSKKLAESIGPSLLNEAAAHPGSR